MGEWGRGVGSLELGSSFLSSNALDAKACAAGRHEISMKILYCDYVYAGAVSIDYIDYFDHESHF